MKMINWLLNLIVKKNTLTTTLIFEPKKNARIFGTLILIYVKAILNGPLHEYYYGIKQEHSLKHTSTIFSLIKRIMKSTVYLLYKNMHLFPITGQR